MLADIAAAYVLNTSELARSRRAAEQLQSALDSRVLIEQAKGKLAGQANISLGEAFETIAPTPGATTSRSGAWPIRSWTTASTS